MPEAIRRRDEGLMDEAEEQGAIADCIGKMLANTRRLTKDREGLSVGEEMLYVGRDGEFYDELSGSWLDPDRVKQARIEEMEEFRKHKVYKKVTVKECWDKTGREPIGVKWVDVNKGDNSSPDYRSRLVAQEIKTDKREDLFAATPPLEAIKNGTIHGCNRGDWIQGRKPQGRCQDRLY